MHVNIVPPRGFKKVVLFNPVFYSHTKLNKTLVFREHFSIGMHLDKA